MKRKENSKLYILLMVGMVSAFGPFVTDFYLPSFPSLMKYFCTTASRVQLSLTFSMIGLAVGQLIIGPISDKYGRKKPLITSLIIFCLSTLGCLYSSDIHVFIAFRLLQGLAGAGGVVISKSIATDLYEGRQLAAFYSMLSSVQGLAPICAPVLGGFLMAITDWKGIFWVLLAIGVLLIICLLFFAESLSKDKRVNGGILSTFALYKPVVGNTLFMRYVLVQAFAMGVMFSYISASPFIFQVHFGASPQVYGLCFGMNAIAIMVGSLMVGKAKEARKGLRCGCICFAMASVLVCLTLIYSESIYFVEMALFLLLFFLGMILPTSTTIALDMERQNSGIASALLGFLMFVFGGVLSPVTGLGNMIYTTSLVIVICSMATLYCYKMASRKEK